MLVMRLLALAAAVGVCVGFVGAPVQGLRLQAVQTGHGTNVNLKALVHPQRSKIDYGVAYDPTNRKLGHVRFERPWTKVEPRGDVLVQVPHTSKQRAVHDSVLLLRVFVSGADVTGVHWGVEDL